MKLSNAEIYCIAFSHLELRENDTGAKSSTIQPPTIIKIHGRPACSGGYSYFHLSVSLYIFTCPPHSQTKRKTIKNWNLVHITPIGISKSTFFLFSKKGPWATLVSKNCRGGFSAYTIDYLVPFVFIFQWILPRVIRTRIHAHTYTYTKKLVGPAY